MFHFLNLSFVVCFPFFLLEIGSFFFTVKKTNHLLSRANKRRFFRRIFEK